MPGSQWKNGGDSEKGSTDYSGVSSGRRSGFPTSVSSAEGEGQQGCSSNFVKYQMKVQEPDSDELSQFRQQWQNDIRSNQLKNKAGKGPAIVDEEEIHMRAKKWFLEGVENEKKGRLHEAIRFYKKAVQLVPDIEFKVCDSVTEKQNEGSQCEEPGEESGDEALEDRLGCFHGECESATEEEDEEDKDVDLMEKLQRFIQRSKSICTPATEQTTTHISALPLEVIIYILRWVVSNELDMRSLELCSLISRGFYVCSRDPEIWRLACLRAWGSGCGTLKSYDSWRTMFLTRPRPKFNGCYISRTTYIRHGENSFQDEFYRPWHVVEYYRYFRFFPDGGVSMLTTPDPPAKVIQLLKTKDAKHPSVLRGRFSMADDHVFIVLHRENMIPTVLRRRKPPVPEIFVQTYHIELQVTNRKHRMNQCLLWKRYCVSGSRGNSESNFEVVSNKFPSFWFSRVKSYTLESEKPLA